MIAVVVGLVLGTAPFLLGRRLGRLVSAGVNIAVAFPGILLALFFAVVFGVGATGAVLAIGLAGAPAFARLVQTLVAGVAARDYVAAARVAGVGRLRILVRHVLPNIAEPLVVNATIGAGGALLSFAGLSFLGLGVQQPQYDWGRLLYDGIGRIYVNAAAALAPGVAVLVAGLAFNLFGESVAKGLGVGVDRRRSGCRGTPPGDGGRRRPSAGRPTPHRARPRPGARRARPGGRLPRAARAGAAGPRRLVRRTPRRGRRHRRGVRLGQVADRARGLPAGRRARPGHGRPGWSCSATTCGPRTPRRSAGCSAPRWPWSSRTR